MKLIIKNPKRTKVNLILKGYSLRELSRKSNVSVGFISALLNRKKTCYPDVAKKLAISLDVEIPYIFDAVDDGKQFDLKEYIMTKGELENETSRV